jgi:hypothetical protein
VQKKYYCGKETMGQGIWRDFGMTLFYNSY